MNIGKRIQEIAKEKKVSAIELAEMIGKSRQAIYDIYHGRVSVNIDLLEKIANALDQPIIDFIDESAKPRIDRQALREVIIEIIKDVIRKNYIYYKDLQTLSKEVHDKAKEGEGLVHLRVLKGEEKVEFVAQYMALKSKIPEKKLSAFADTLLDDFFENMGPLGDRLSLKSMINKYFDEKGDGYISKILI
jgi:transcriptional regulator with XRE-family HTH domain